MNRRPASCFLHQFIVCLFLTTATVQAEAPVTHLFLSWANVDAGDTRFPVDRTKVSPDAMPILEKTKDYYSVELSDGERAPRRINTATGVHITIEKAKKVGPWLVPDKPWEVRGLYEGTVLHDEGKYRLWYQAFYDRGQVVEVAPRRYKLRYGSAMCYAESDDGMHWRKPSLGLVEYKGSKDNNIVSLDDKVIVGAVFIDPSAPPAERYKMVNPCSTKEFDPNAKAQGALAGAYSADGLHWTALPKPLWVGLNSDTYPSACYDTATGTYIGYFRTHEIHRRSIGLSETKDFAHWPIPTSIIVPGAEESPTDDYYTNDYEQYPGDPTGRLMFVSIYHRDISYLDIRLATSLDGRAWNWVSHEPIVERGPVGAWDAGKLYVCPYLTQLPNGMIAVPLLGFNWAHNEFWRDYYEEDRSHAEGFGWAEWQDGRIAGVEAKTYGEFTTFPFIVAGSAIQVNARSSTSGYVHVTCVIDGKKGAEPTVYRARELIGDHGWTTLQWDDLPNPDALAHQNVRLHFELYNAKVFGFRL